MTPIRIAILGAAGRMGRSLIDALPHHKMLSLGAALDRPEALLAQPGEIVPGVTLSCDLIAATADFEVLIDFTRPEGTLLALDACVAAGRGLVIGTTGFSAEQRERIAAAALQVPICLSGNFSIGVNLCLALTEHAARVLDGFDIEIIETHHRHKVDAPSGTALMLGESAARGAGLTLAENAVYARQGHTGARERSDIGFSTVRGGDVVGDHTVMFLGDGERVEISHKASNRANFANGALRAAGWLAQRPPGLYSMRDVLA